MAIMKRDGDRNVPLGRLRTGRRKASVLGEETSKKVRKRAHLTGLRALECEMRGEFVHARQSKTSFANCKLACMTDRVMFRGS